MLKNWNLLSKYVFMCLLIPGSYILAAFSTSSTWNFDFSQKNWTSNLETVVNRFSQPVKFYFQIYWNITHRANNKNNIKANNKRINWKKKFMFKMSKTDTRTKSRSSALIVNFEQILHFFLVFQLLILNI